MRAHGSINGLSRAEKEAHALNDARVMPWTCSGSVKSKSRPVRSSVNQHCDRPELETRLPSGAEAEGLSVEVYIERIARDDEAAEQEFKRWPSKASTQAIPLCRMRRIRQRSAAA